MNPTLTLFLIGAAGALAPEIIRLWTIAKNGGTFTWSWFYIVISILFIGLGGLIAIVLPAENLRAAFYAGVTAPVLINTAVKKAGGNRRRSRVVKSAQGAQHLSRFDSFVEGL